MKSYSGSYKENSSSYYIMYTYSVLSSEMTKSLNFIFIAVILIFIQDANAMYLSINPSYDRFSNSSLSDNNAVIAGIGVGASLGFQLKKIPIEIIFGQNNLAGEVLHDGSKRQIKSNQMSFGIRALIPVSKRLYFSTGYSKSTIKFVVDEDSSFTRAGIIDTYELSNKELSGFLFGAGLSLNRNPKRQFYVEYNITNYTEDSSSLNNLIFGFRFRFK